MEMCFWCDVDILMRLQQHMTGKHSHSELKLECTVCRFVVDAPHSFPAILNETLRLFIDCWACMPVSSELSRGLRRCDYHIVTEVPTIQVSRAITCRWHSPRGLHIRENSFRRRRVPVSARESTCVNYIPVSFPCQHLLQDSFEWWHRGNSLVILGRKALDGESNQDDVVHEVVLTSLLLHSPSSYHCSTPLPSLDIHSGFGSDRFHGTSICSHGVVMSCSEFIQPVTWAV